MKKLLNRLLTELSELYGDLRLLSFYSTGREPHSQHNMKTSMSKDARQIVDWSFLTPVPIRTDALLRNQRD